MSDLPQPLRGALAGEFHIGASRISLHRRAEDGTEKLLLALADDQRIECVLIREQRAAHHLHQHAGRLRDGVCLLRKRLGWRGA